jgi:mitochondrial fission protein ELM1
MNEAPLWLVTGDKLGDNAQLLVIAEALGLPYEVRRVIPRKEYVYGKPPFEPSLYHLDMEKSDPLVPPWPELVLTIGRRPAMAAQWIRQQSGGKTKVVLLGRPKKMLEEFALVIITGQFLMPKRDNILSLDLPLMRVDAAKIDTAVKIWQPSFQAMKQPVTALLIGGPTKPYCMDAAVIDKLLQQLKKQPGSGSLFISTSRRTPDAVVDYLRQHKPPDSTLYCWHPDDSNNPYFALLGLADYFVVTGDSLSMMVEIARLGKPLAIYPLPEQGGFMTQAKRQAVMALRRIAGYLPGALVGYPRDLGRTHQYLLKNGLASTVGQPFVAPEGAMEDQLAQVVARIKQLIDTGVQKQSSC